MFGFNKDFHYMEAEKENYCPQMAGKISPFDIEAKRNEILERFFSKSSEISILTNEMTNTTNNLSKRYGEPRLSDAMEITDPPYTNNYNYRSVSFFDSFPSNINSNYESKFSRDNQRRSSASEISQIIKPKPKGDEFSGFDDDDKDHANLKAPIEEMRENIDHLEMLLKYQQNFYQTLENEMQDALSQIESYATAMKKVQERTLDYENDASNYEAEFESEYKALTEKMFEAEGKHNELLAEYEMQNSKIKELQEFILEKDKGIRSLQKVQKELLQQKQAEEEEMQRKRDYLASLEKESGLFKKLTEDLEADLRLNFSRKKILNKELQEMKGNIRVYCRIKPLLDEENKIEEEELPSDKLIKLRRSSQLELTVPPSKAKSEINMKELKFNFDQIFDQNSTQTDVFYELSQLIQTVMDGQNICVFAFGQTGTGKTFTMEGDSTTENKGLIPRSVEQVFEQISYLRKCGWKHTVHAVFQQIHVEQVRDLLTGQTDQKVEATPVESLEQFYSLFKRASLTRSLAETEHNEQSSRSHVIFQLRIKGRNFESEEVQGNLTMVDLAGSEKLFMDRLDSDNLKETYTINKSLTSLGDVLIGLAKNDKHLPYRNSKLTFTLQNYLDENTKTVMLAHILPSSSCFSQTLCALKFVSKLKQQPEPAPMKLSQKKSLTPLKF